MPRRMNILNGTMHDRMNPARQMSVPSIFDLPSAEELDASLAPTGLLPLVVLLLDLQSLADAVRIAVSKGAKILATDLHSSSEVARVKHLFGSTDHHLMTLSAEASKLGSRRNADPTSCRIREFSQQRSATYISVGWRW